MKFFRGFLKSEALDGANDLVFFEIRGSKSFIVIPSPLKFILCIINAVTYRQRKHGYTCWLHDLVYMEAMN